ncbi:unnamed protein product, partial [Heterosigma akashiwo]
MVGRHGNLMAASHSHPLENTNQPGTNFIPPRQMRREKTCHNWQGGMMQA